MQITRRGFTGGALSFALASPFAVPALGQGRPQFAGALGAIRAYAEAHRSYWGLPGLTLGLTTPDGVGTVLNFGFANAEAKTPITAETRFQIGSISKVMTAGVIHQLVAEGRLSLTDRVSNILPTIPLPAGNPIQIQHLLDHIAGLPSDAPLFPEGGLWTAYAPGEHWHYSNTAYDMLGKVAEHIAGKPLGRLIEERLLSPLGMRRSHGAIVADDRLLYAQGYEAADQIVPFVRGVPLAPAGWVDVTFGAGCVASTADDMLRFMRTLANAVLGRGGLGLSPQHAQSFTTHVVPSDTPGMRYGNGLMHVTNAGRSYLHHTGGMVSFASSFHLDKASGVGAFASSTITAFAEYRPRLLTRFAVDALTDAMAGKAASAPPSLETLAPNAAAYLGRYSGPAGAFEVRAGNPLTLVANGRSAPLQYWGADLFRTLHPDFRRFTLKFERARNAVTGASWGAASYVRDGSGGTLPASNAELAKLAGRYVNDSPWLGMGHVVERGGRLWIGTEVPLFQLSGNNWRIGEEAWSPERASFANFIDGCPQALFISGEKFIRHDV